MTELVLPMPTTGSPKYERVIDFLRTNGITGDITMTVTYDGLFKLRVEEDQVDAVTALMTSYADAPTQRELIERQIMQDARATLTTIKNKGPANWTAQDKVLLAIALQLRDLRDATK